MKERWSSSRIDPRLTFKIDCRGSLPRPSQPIIQWTPLLFLRWQQISSRKDWHNDVSAFCLAIHPELRALDAIPRAHAPEDGREREVEDDEVHDEPVRVLVGRDLLTATWARVRAAEDCS